MAKLAQPGNQEKKKILSQPESEDVPNPFEMTMFAVEDFFPKFPQKVDFNNFVMSTLNSIIVN